MTTKAPNPNEQKTRTLRMDDARWKFFRESLGSPWLRSKIDEAILEASKGKS